MKVGFFLDNTYYTNIDFSAPEKGNPGIRGTQYMIWMLCCLLPKMCRDIQTCMFAPYIDTMPSTLHCVQCADAYQALEAAQKEQMDIIVLRKHHEESTFFAAVGQSGVRCIIWSHNFESDSIAKKIWATQLIKRHVCVGRQQYERLRDHAVFPKSTYIYNALDFNSYHPQSAIDAPKENIILYMGALNAMKGFHLLARVWPKVLKHVPDAQLYILGSGNMGSNAKLGKYHIASPAYEKRFLKYLTNADGTIIPGVHFTGSLGGEDKQRLIERAKVGIANPTGKGETFCIVAIEYGALGIPVISANKNGLLDTVRHEDTGLLFRTKRGLVRGIVELLQDDQKRLRLGENAFRFVRTAFSFDTICDQWHRLLTDVYLDRPQQPDYTYNYPLNQMKWLREINRKIKCFSIFSRLPSILWYESLPRKLYDKMRSRRSGKV